MNTSTAALKAEDTFLVQLNFTNLSALDFCQCGDMGADSYTDAYATYNFMVVIIMIPILITFGIYTNLVNIYIYTRPRMARISGNLYLTALGASDLMVLAAGTFTICADSARSHLHLKLVDEVFIESITYMLPIGYMAQTCSMYFTVSAAIDCYIKICWPKYEKNWCKTARAKQVIVGTVLLAIFYNLVRFWHFELRSCRLEPEPDSKDDVIKRELCPTEIYLQINNIYNLYMYTIFMSCLPFFFLLLLNSLVLRRIRLTTRPLKMQKKAQMVRTATSPSSRLLTRTCSVASDENTQTMIMVVALFLFCNTLPVVINMVETFMDLGVVDINYMTDASNFLVILNSSINFLIYLHFSKTYKRLFVQHICGLKLGFTESQALEQQQLQQHVEMQPEPRSDWTPEQRTCLSLPFANGNSNRHVELREATSTETCECESPLLNGKKLPYYCSEV